MIIRLPDPLRCMRCDYVWVPRKADVRICPRCKSKLWATPKGEKS